MSSTNGTKIFKVDHFLGINEAADGFTELKMGEASKMENFYITDERNLKSRPGTRQVVSIEPQYDGDRIVAMWSGAIDNCDCIALAYMVGTGICKICIYQRNGDSYTELISATIDEVGQITAVKLFSMGDSVYVFAYVSDVEVVCSVRFHTDADGELTVSFEEDAAYIPLILTGGTPAGGGTVLEPVNILVNQGYLEYSADGAATAYVLPSDVWAILSVTVDQKEATGTYDSAAHTFTFDAAPAKGVNNVRFRAALETDTAEARIRFVSMPHCEAYNGATDTRLFFYGDGTNVCYYTGAPTYGSGLYIPAGNEIAVDASSSAITGMVRHYTRLMAFKPDGAFTINYEPVTLADGSVIAGFYVRPASRAIGNDMDGQIQTVENYPRTLCAGNLYEWRHSAAYYQDERYAKLISQKVSRTLAAADPKKIVTCDDDTAGAYYMFLNDDAGTVLVNHYRIDAWSVYTGDVFKNIRFAVFSRGDVLFANDTSVYTFDPTVSYDAPTVAGGKSTPIQAVWESGYMAFGADYRRKYSSHIWLSMLPESGSNMDITVSTDRREDYLVKSAGLPIFGFDNLDFSAFSFVISRIPKIQRILMKVKKFVYYKLIFRLTHPGARATVLGYDQKIRYSSNVK